MNQGSCFQDRERQFRCFDKHQSIRSRLEESGAYFSVGTKFKIHKFCQGASEKDCRQRSRRAGWLTRG